MRYWSLVVWLFCAVWCYVCGMGNGLFKSKTLAPPKAAESVSSPTVEDTEEGAESTARAKARRRYGLDRTVTARGGDSNLRVTLG